MATSCMVLTAPQCTVESTGPPERELWAVLAISGNGQLNIVLTMIALRFQTSMGNNLYISSFSGSNSPVRLYHTSVQRQVGAT
jgi:hypothetical protein